MRIWQRVLRLGLLCLSLPAVADYRVDVVAGNLEHPWSLAFLPDGRLLITERPGRLLLVTAEGEKRALDGVPPVFAQSQAGLMEVALAPDFADSGALYLTYVCGTRQANSLCLARGQFDGQGLSGVTRIFEAQPRRKNAAHYGGRLAFLPDGSLILPLGDGFDYREQAQNPANHLGKVLRLNALGQAPGDNPFSGRDGIAPEIYSLGHRNVQGVVYDSERQHLFAVEHGPRGGDELNELKPGGNYGWPLATRGLDYTYARVTPFSDLPGYIAPLLDWTPSIAPAGMALYRGDLFPEWDGDLLVAALAAKGLYRVRLTAQGAEVIDILLADREARIRDVRVGPDGAVYVLTDSTEGQLLRITPRQQGS